MAFPHQRTAGLMVQEDFCTVPPSIGSRAHYVRKGALGVGQLDDISGVWENEEICVFVVQHQLLSNELFSSLRTPETRNFSFCTLARS